MTAGPLYLALLAPRAPAAETPEQNSAAVRFDRRHWASVEKLRAATALSIDDRGRVFVAESPRTAASVISVEGKAARIQDDLGIETVAQRRTVLQRWIERGELAPEITASGVPSTEADTLLRRHSEVVALLEDTDSDGRADRRTVFATAFNDEVDGPAAGVLALDSDVWFVCAPHLWLLRDLEKDNRANLRTALIPGLGIRVGKPQHSPGPITFGPEGRLYFAVGDRGYNVHSREDMNFYGPLTGGIFRCWPDGRGLELFARGFRAPTALAFDQAGRLFVIDDDLYFVPEGMEAGWEASLADKREALDAWSSENRRWCLSSIGSAGQHVSDLAFCPSTALVPPLQGRLLAAGRNGISAVDLDPAGAGFRVAKIERLDSPPGIQKICFAPDGRLFVLTGSGNDAAIDALSAPADLRTPGMQETAAFLKMGFRHRRVDELAPLLAHPDSRVRFRAQLALVEKGWRAVVPELITIAQSGRDLRARRHAVWAMRALARDNSLLLTPLIGLLGDSSEDVRLLVAQVLADGGCTEAGPALLPLLNDPAPPVRAAAAVALGKLAPSGARAALLEHASHRADEDRFLDHSIVMGLGALGDAETLFAAVRDSPTTSVRRAGLLALRRLQSAKCVHFLGDASPEVALEAARAIYDLPINSALPALAEMLGKNQAPAAKAHAFLRLSLAANLRLGRADDAARTAAFAAQPPASIPEDLRMLALEGLSSWDAPPAREPVWGRHAPAQPREATLARKPLVIHLPDILKNAAGPARELAQRLYTTISHGPATAGEMSAFVADEAQPDGLRLFFLRELDARGSAETAENAGKAAMQSQSAKLRIEARAMMVRRKPAQALELVAQAMSSPDVVEKQSSIKLLESLKTKQGDQWLLQLIQRAILGQLDLVVVPELIEAAQARERGNDGREFREALDKLRTAWRSASVDSLRAWRAAEEGGDPRTGHALFLSDICRCADCHAINGRGGGTAPDLAGVAERFSASGLLECVVQPSARIATGYGFVTAKRRDGSAVSGVLKDAKSDTLNLRTAAASVELPRTEIK